MGVRTFFPKIHIFEHQFVAKIIHWSMAKKWLSMLFYYLPYKNWHAFVMLILTHNNNICYSRFHFNELWENFRARNIVNHGQIFPTSSYQRKHYDPNFDTIRIFYEICRCIYAADH